MHFVTAEWLRCHDVCPADIASFNEYYPKGVDALEHLCSLAERNPAWGIWVGTRLPEFTQIRSRWLLRILNDPEYGAKSAGNKRALKVIRAVIALLERDIKGDAPSREEWTEAAALAAEAAAATWAAARWVAVWAAGTAAEEGAETVGAARVAAWAARAAAWAAEAEVAAKVAAKAVARWAAKAGKAGAAEALKVAVAASAKAARAVQAAVALGKAPTKQAAGDDWFVSDRGVDAKDISGDAEPSSKVDTKAPKPDKDGVPRLAANLKGILQRSAVVASRRRRLAAGGEEPPSEVVEPTAEQPEEFNPFTGLSSKALAAMVKALASVDKEELINDKAASHLIEQMTSELSKRPAEPAEDGQPVPAPAPTASPAPSAPPVAPVTASSKVAVLPSKEWDDVYKELKHKHKVDNPAAVVWSMYDKGFRPHKKESSYWNQDTGVVEEGNLSDVNEARTEAKGAYGHALGWEGAKVPEGERPIDLRGKFAGKRAAGPLSAEQACRKARDIQERLNKLYMDAKPITTANDSRPVRDAVESVYRAAIALDEAARVLEKQQKAEDEADKQQQAVQKEERKAAASGLFGGLVLPPTED